jgi:hypothetical protein
MTQCKGCKATFPPKEGKIFCSARCRAAYWSALHLIKRKHPKRIRDRERDRLLRTLHSGETLAELRERLAHRGNPWPDAETAVRIERYMDAAEDVL